MLQTPMQKEINLVKVEDICNTTPKTCKVQLVFLQIVGTISNVFKHHHHSCCLVANVNEKICPIWATVVCGYERTTQFIKSVKNLWALQNCSSLYLQQRGDCKMHFSSLKCLSNQSPIYNISLSCLSNLSNVSRMS